METTVWGFYSSAVFFIDSNCPFSLITTTYIQKTTVWGFYSLTVFFIDSNCPSSLITTTCILKSHYDLKNINDIGIYRKSWTDIYYYNIDIFAIFH